MQQAPRQAVGWPKDGSKSQLQLEPVGAELAFSQRLHRQAERHLSFAENIIYELHDDSASAVKVYTVTDSKDREPKVAAMIAADLASKSTPILKRIVSVPRWRGRSGFEPAVAI
jgi:hypothetical protein